MLKVKEAVLFTPCQRARALTTIAQNVFKSEFVNRVLDSPLESDLPKGCTPISLARESLLGYQRSEVFVQGESFPQDWKKEPSSGPQV